FDWEELRDPARRLHRYLFELHPERNAWSFFRTLAGAMRPRRFWKELAPTQPSNLRRLILYALLVALTAALYIVPIAAITAQDFNSAYTSNRGYFKAAWGRPEMDPMKAEIDRLHMTVDEYLEQNWPTPRSFGFWTRTLAWT